MSIYGHMLESSVGYTVCAESFENENNQFLSIIESVDNDLLMESEFRLDKAKIKAAFTKVIEAFKKWAKTIYEKITNLIKKVKAKFSKKTDAENELDNRDIKGLVVSSSKTGELTTGTEAFKMINKMLDTYQNMHEDMMKLTTGIYNQVKKYQTHDIKTNTEVFHNWSLFDADTRYSWMKGLTVHISDDYTVRFKDADNFINNVKVGGKDLDEANTVMRSNSSEFESAVSEIAKLSMKQMDEDPSAGVNTQAGYTTVGDCIKATSAAISRISVAYQGFHSRYVNLVATLISYYTVVLGEIYRPTLD